MDGIDGERLRQAWRRRNPGREDSEMPESLRAGESGITADPSAFAVTAADPDFDESGPTKTFLNAFRKLLKGKVSDDDWNDALKKARGSAGGKTAARKRKAQTASEARAHAERHPEPVAGCEYCHGDYVPEKMPKADDRASYRPAEVSEAVEGQPGFVAGEACGNCRFYRWGSCQLVEGTIEADYVCDLHLPPPRTYVPTPSIYAAAEDGGRFRLMNELPAGFAESVTDAPEWINVLPKPGTYAHPRYGSLVITRERNARFVANFDARVYQQDLPLTLDIEHDAKMTGGLGYIEQMRLNEDGSVEAKTVWTERGKAVLAEDRFRYFSPEWWEEWTDPQTGITHSDLLVGGAITVRPFFKEGALRPLVATEDGVIETDDEDGTPIAARPVIVLRALTERRAETTGGSVMPEATGVPAVAATVALSEAEVQAFREFQADAANRAERDRQFAEMQASVESLRQANDALAAESRRRRFSDEVMGRAEGGDGAVWVGGIDDNVAQLERIAAQFGEDSEAFRAAVALGRAAAKAVASTVAFSAIGSDGGGVASAAAGRSSMAEAQRFADGYRAADASLTNEQALARAFAEHPALYERYTAGE